MESACQHVDQNTNFEVFTMSNMSQLAYDIEQLYIEGLGVTAIATQLECPVAIVHDWINTEGVSAQEQEQDPVDGMYA